MSNLVSFIAMGAHFYKIQETSSYKSIEPPRGAPFKNLGVVAPKKYKKQIKSRERHKRILQNTQKPPAAK